MKIKISSYLLVLCVMTGAFIFYFSLMYFDIYQNDAIQIILGIPFLLFSPGFALALALFPRIQDLSLLRRMAYSFGLSLVIVAFIGVILNYSPLGIKEESVFISNTFFVLITAVIALIRSTSVPGNTKVDVEQHREKPAITRSKLDLPISVAMIILLIGSLSFLGYFFSKQKADEVFTQFYFVQSSSSVSAYPTKLKLGQEGVVTLAIINHENRDVNYRIESSFNGLRINEIGPLVLADNQTWQGNLKFMASNEGDNQKLEVSLFLDNNPLPYKEPLYLWINVN